MNKHTPPPWRVDIGASLRVLARDERATIICEVSGAPSNPTAQANARLIAAAPEMLAALKEVAQFFNAPGDGCFSDDALVRLNAAIAAAKGEP